VDIMLGALDEMLGANMQFVMLGTGAPEFEKAYQELAKRFPNRAAVKIAFEERLSHRVEAGCDFFLMPSHFEPCGLNQMYAMRYGTVPVVRNTGGLKDTVIDYEDPGGYGIRFLHATVGDLTHSIWRSVQLYRDKNRLRQVRKKMMNLDFSWEKSVKEYISLYESVK